MKWVESLTKSLSRYDRRLNAKYVGNGLVNILFSDSNYNQLVFSLTDDWTMDGEPVRWGYMPILERLQRIDMSGRAVSFDEKRKHREQVKEDKHRMFKNELDAGLIDKRRDFAKAFNDINTSTLDKTKDKRRLKNGN